MKKKGAKENQLSNFLRKILFVEAVVIVILSVIILITQNVSLIRVLFVLGIITAFFGIFLLFLKLSGILDTNPLTDLASAYLLLSICCVLIIAVSGVPSIEVAIDSLNKSIESLEGLPNFMETQTEAMNKSIETLGEIHDFIIKPVPE
jgi:hypothetical protein